MANKIKRPDMIVDITLKEAIDEMIDNVTLKHNVSRSDARKMIISSICYNIVADQIYGQVEYMMQEKPEASYDES